ncbi:MAG: SBBP repeat-containing protein, partial [Bacteroidota bacterium]
DGDDVSFILQGSYDHGKPLVIECARQVLPSPSTQSIANLKWSVFYGGSEDDWCQAIANDDAGNLYSTGTTLSANFPVSVGVVFPFFQGLYDAYVNRFKNLDELDWCTFFGGTNVE